MNEFIWANLAYKEDPKSNQTFEGIGANKKVQKSINVIMLLMVIIHMFLASKRIRKSRKFMPQIVSIISAQSKTYFGEFQPCKLYDQTFRLLCKSLVINLVYHGQNIKDRSPIRKIVNYLQVTFLVFIF